MKKTLAILLICTGIVIAGHSEPTMAVLAADAESVEVKSGREGSEWKELDRYLEEKAKASAPENMYVAKAK